MQRVMIIEDDLTELQIYQKQLEEAGYTVMTEYDGQKAVDRILKEKPDILLIDLGLPHVSGTDIMREVRKDMWGMSLPMIVLTQHDCNDETINEILQFNPSYYIVKSKTSPDEVVEKVNHISKAK